MKPSSPLSLLVLAFLVSTAFGVCNSKVCRKQFKKPCVGGACGVCLLGYNPGPTADDPCVFKCKIDNAQCITAHRGNCSRGMSGLCGDCVSGYVGLEGPAYPNQTCVKSNDPPAINDLITQIMLAYDCTTALADPETFKTNLKNEFCSAMEQADCDRLVFGDPKCASSGTTEVSSTNSIADIQNTIADMTVKASGGADAISSKAILMAIDEDMSDPTSDLMKGSLMSKADTSTSLLSKSRAIANYRCKGGVITTNKATCPPRKTTTTLSVNTVTAVYGQTITLTAAIGINHNAGTNPVGKVIFKNNNLQIGSPNINSLTKKATLVFKVTRIGQNKISASYIEDDQFYGSQSTLKTITVGRAWTKIQVTSSKNPSAHGQSIVLTFTVAPTLAYVTAIPTGKVKVFDGGKFLQSIPLGPKGIGSLSVNNFSAGAHTITAQYQGNTYFKKSTTKTALSQRVN